MKRFLATAAAIVLCNAPALAASPPVFNWTGFYVGGHVGSGVQDGQLSGLPAGSTFGIPVVTVVPTPPIAFHSNGVVAGGQLGYNVQWLSNWVAGVEADFSHSHSSSSGAFSIPGFPFPGPNGTAEFKTDSLATLRGRLGYAAGNLLFYGTGGLAWTRASLTTSGSTFCFCIPFFIGFVPFASSDSRWVQGWTAGGGVDYAFAPNWFVRLEYLRVDFGTKNFTVDPALGSTLPLASRFDVVRFGLNYKFGN